MALSRNTIPRCSPSNESTGRTRCDLRPATSAKTGVVNLTLGWIDRAYNANEAAACQWLWVEHWGPTDAVIRRYTRATVTTANLYLVTHFLLSVSAWNTRAVKKEAQSKEEEEKETKMADAANWLAAVAGFPHALEPTATMPFEPWLEAVCVSALILQHRPLHEAAMLRKMMEQVRNYITRYITPDFVSRRLRKPVAELELPYLRLLSGREADQRENRGRSALHVNYHLHLLISFFWHLYLAYNAQKDGFSQDRDT